MKVAVEKWFGTWRATVVQGCQKFTIGYEGNKREAEFMARMFRIALKNHDKEKSKC